MKEQVNVDEEVLNELNRLQNESKALRNFIKYLYHSKTEKPIEMEFNIDELIRLKRLDEKVNNKIKELKLYMDSIIENQAYGGRYSESDDRKCLKMSETELEYLKSLKE